MSNTEKRSNILGDDNNVGDCLLFSNISFLYIKYLKKTYRGYNEIKYMKIIYDKWGNDDNDFHYYLRFKFNHKWYRLDRYKCHILTKICGKKTDLEKFHKYELLFHLRMLGYKTLEELQIDVYKIVDDHLKNLLLTLDSVNPKT